MQNEVRLSDLKSALVPVLWDKLSAVVLKNNSNVLVIRTPSDDVDELEQVALALQDVLDDTRYLVIPYSVEVLTLRIPERKVRKFGRKIAVVLSQIIDIIKRTWERMWHKAN